MNADEIACKSEAPVGRDRVWARVGNPPIGVEANQTSPLSIGPVRPVFGRPPIRDLRQLQLRARRRLFLPLPGVGVPFQHN